MYLYRVCVCVFIFEIALYTILLVPTQPEGYILKTTHPHIYGYKTVFKIPLTTDLASADNPLGHYQ